MKSIDKFLETLSANYYRLRWIGWKQDSLCNGVFTAYNAHFNGFEVCIKRFDLDQGAWSRQTWWVTRHRQRVNQNTKLFFELTVSDSQKRFGRASILNKTVFLPEDKEFAVLEELFVKIVAVGQVFTPHATVCLTADQALIALCDEFGKQSLSA